MEYYKKVYIKSEADLPKEDGNYICHHEGEPIYKMDLFPFKVKESHWFTHIDWYLQPCEEKNVTDEEIKKWAKQRIREIDLDQWDVFELLIEGAKAMRDGKIPTKD